MDFGGKETTRGWGPSTLRHLKKIAASAQQPCYAGMLFMLPPPLSLPPHTPEFQCPCQHTAHSTAHSTGQLCKAQDAQQQHTVSSRRVRWCVAASVASHQMQLHGSCPTGHSMPSTVNNRHEWLQQHTARGRASLNSASPQALCASSPAAVVVARETVLEH